MAQDVVRLSDGQLRYVGKERWDEPISVYDDMLDIPNKLESAIVRHRETWFALSVIKNGKRYVEYIDSFSEEEIERGVNMDAALDYIERTGRQEGRKEGAALVNQRDILLFEAGREKKFMGSLSDEKLSEKLFVEFGFEHS